MRQDPLRRAAKKHFSNRTVTVGSHDQEVCFRTGYNFTDDIGQPACPPALSSGGSRHDATEYASAGASVSCPASSEPAMFTSVLRISASAPSSAAIRRARAGMDAAVVGNQNMANASKRVAGYQDRANRAANHAWNQGIQPPFSAAVGCASQNYQVVRHRLARDDFTGNAYLEVGTARNSFRPALFAQLLQAFPGQSDSSRPKVSRFPGGQGLPRQA